MFSSEILLANTSSGFYNNIATRSLKFTQHSTGSNNERLTRTMGTVDSATDFSINFWVKRSDLLNSRNTSYPMTLLTFRDGTSGTALNEVQFGETGSWGDGDSLCITHTNSGARILATNNLLRDTTAWYNIHIRADLDNGTASEKLKIYINNVEATYATDNRSSYSEMTGFKAGAWTIGDYYNYGYSPACLLALFTYTDGHKYLPTDFCEVKEGALIPKDPSVTYGNGGFRLAFASGTGSSADASGVGADTSGNDNHWTATNIVAGNVHLDNPENNFCTLKGALDHQTSATASEGNLTLTRPGSNAWSVATCTFAVSSGKWWYEACASGSIGIGYNIGYQNVDTYFSATTDGKAVGSFFYYGVDGVGAYYYVGTSDSGTVDNDIEYYTGDSGARGTTFVVGDVVGIALDLDSDPPTVQHYVNGVAGGPAREIPEGNTLTPFIAQYSSGAVTTFNFGSDPTFGGITIDGSSADATDSNGNGLFYDTPPSGGFLALCSKNLPETTISPSADTQSKNFFDTVLYTGNGSDDRAVTGLNFQPDLGIFTQRNSTAPRMWFDSSRGNSKQLKGNLTTAESDQTNKQKTFTSDGYTLGTDTQINGNTSTYVVWNFRANGGTTTTNDASATGVGNIDSVYQANTDAGFSIVTWQYSTSADNLVAHGLGAIPHMIIVKSRTSAYNWDVYHQNLTATTKRLILNTTDDEENGFFDTTPTSTVFEYNTSGASNNDNMVAYCFTEVAGFSSIGTYVGNSSENGSVIFTGFRPAFVMVKLTSASGEDWIVWDNKRDVDNVTHNKLYLNTDGAEVTDTSNRMIDILSNGFKHRADHVSTNTGGTYLYIAFAEIPQKYSNAF